MAVITAQVRNVGIGALEVVMAPEQLRTVLGSCVGIAVFDTGHKVAGLAHAILPTATGDSGEPGKFADRAVDNLVAQLIAAGANKKNLNAKLVGGAAMFGKDTTNGLGDRNAEAARARLDAQQIPVIAEALGGTKGRKMFLDPETGEVTVEIIGEQPETL